MNRLRKLRRKVVDDPLHDPAHCVEIGGDPSDCGESGSLVEDYSNGHLGICHGRQRVLVADQTGDEA